MTSFNEQIYFSKTCINFSNVGYIIEIIYLRQQAYHRQPINQLKRQLHTSVCFKDYILDPFKVVFDRTSFAFVLTHFITKNSCLSSCLFKKFSFSMLSQRHCIVTVVVKTIIFCIYHQICKCTKENRCILSGFFHKDVF